jgi:GntR family transcriptional regulator
MAAEGLSPYIAEQKLKADRASAREAELLRLEPGEPGLRLTCTTFDQTGLPIEYSEAFYPGARYEYQVTLRVTK